ncbi:Wzz/FepE/Etk N-terminal domain-containing protein, partial [Selenomonas sp. ND2010]|uniref:GumC family protein n=1 Tax=Selenomonas sp. ND2010 TaxID=1410618 RepID=UPI00051BB9D3
MENEESIDLGRLMQIMLEQKKVVGGIVAGCTALAIGTAFILPKQYESTTLVQTRSAGKDIGGAVAMAAAMGINIGGSSSNASPLNYIELMKSRRVLEPIIDEIEWPDDKKPDAKAFAKKNLKIENTKQTNLITVTATGRTPEEAQLISQGVVDNFLTMQTENSQQTQSLLVTFLNDRIENAKQEADDAAAKLAAFQKEHKLYSPSDQAKLAIEQLNAYDKTIGEMQVAQKSAQAQYDVATQKLGEQKAGAASYNINDNSTVQSIRAQIVAKEVELVGLRQKYTDNHPSVIAAQRQLTQLSQSLSDEVGAVVNSNAASLNSAQMELLKNQAVAQAQAS